MMNISGGYPMMGGISGMMGMNNMGGSGNVNQAMTMKYGCEDCFRKNPYPYEYPKPVLSRPQEAVNSSFFGRLLSRILG